jgi:periplasmic protein TonB
MDFARRQRDPKRHLVGFTFVVLLHVLVIYGLMTGLARQVVEVIKKPVSATIVEEIKKPPPPPPPPPKRIEPPKVQAPVQPYVPPPDIPQPPPVIEAPTITAVTPTPPPEPYVIAPPPPPVVVAPPKPAVRRGIARISGDDPSYPREAIKAGVDKGRVVARLRIDEKGNVTEVEIIAASPPRVFDRVVRDALSEWKFRAEGEKYVGEVEINFTLKD